jgi:sugar lactone lactonase YvrE
VREVNKKILEIAIFLMVISMLATVFSAGAKKPDYSLNGIGKVLVRGSPIYGANGIMFDDEDRLYIASISGEEIVVMDPKSGNILERIPASGPDDLTFGPDNSLYYTSIMDGFVFRVSPDGTTTSQYVAPGVNPITFSADGRLFVACDFLGDGLYELDPELVDPPVQIAGPPLTPLLGFLNGMDFGPDGLLYAPVWLFHEVVSIDVDDFTYPMLTVCDEAFGITAAVKFDSQGRLYVADQRKGEISRVDIASGEKEIIATGLFGLDNLAFDSHDQLYVSSAQDGSIFEVLPSGETRMISKGGFISPSGVVVVADSHAGESVFVADGWALREFDGLTGRAESIERSWIAMPGSITAPGTVSADGDNLILSSILGSAVQMWDLQTGTGFTIKNYMGTPMIPLNAIKFGSEIVIAELGAGSQRVIRASDDFVIADVYGVPMGLAAIGDNLYVADWALGWVVQIVTNGVPTYVPVAMGLSNPEGLAVDLDGNLLVVESGVGRVSRINLGTGVVTTLVEGLELGSTSSAMPWGNFNGVAVGSTGYIYVTGDVANLLYRLKPV